MISYQPFWNTLKEKEITQYSLINKYHISAGQLSRLRANGYVSTHTIDRLCDILECKVEDIMMYVSDSMDSEMKKSSDSEQIACKDIAPSTMTKDIPLYNPSYSAEENQQVHQFIEEASDSQLVEWIYKLCDLYPDSEKAALEKALNQLIEESIERYQMEERYEILKDCIMTWTKYETELRLYCDAWQIRKAYEEYCQLAQKQKSLNSSINGFFLSDIYDELKKKKTIQRNDETVRRYLFSENAKHGIKCPDVPHEFYSTLEEITVTELTAEDSLKKLGTPNLKYLLTTLLQYVDIEGPENAASVILTFLGRKFLVYSSHKKAEALFSSKIYTYKELEEKCSELLNQIKGIKRSCDDLSKLISKTSETIRNHFKYITE